MSEWDFATGSQQSWKLLTLAVTVKSDLTLLQRYNKVDVGETLSVDTLTAFLKRKFPKANAERILGIKSEYDEKRKVSKINCFLFVFN